MTTRSAVRKARPNILGHRPRKRFGQHFLASPGIVAKIVAAIEPHKDDAIVEIGPGLGALTEPLLARIERLAVVEIDRDLAARLRSHHPPTKLAVHEADALSFDFGALAQNGRIKIVGNLPYNVSTPLLFHLAAYAECVERMVFMLQKEVVERMVAAPGSAAYGRLSVMLQYRFAIEKLFSVPPGAFVPPPQVESAVARLTPRALATAGGDERARDDDLFARLVAAAFGQRRKMLRNALAEFGGESWLAASGIAPTARAEELSVADYVRLANAIGGG